MCFPSCLVNQRKWSSLKNTKREIVTLLLLLVLLGLTWGVIFFSFGDLTTPALYVFCILNPLQGQESSLQRDWICTVVLWLLVQKQIDCRCCSVTLWHFLYFLFCRFLHLHLFCAVSEKDQRHKLWNTNQSNLKSTNCLEDLFIYYRDQMNNVYFTKLT